MNNAGLILDCDRALFEPAINAVSATHARLAFEHRVRPDTLIPLFEQVVAILRVDMSNPAKLELFLGRGARILLPLRAEVVARPVRAAGPDQVRQGMRQGTPSLLAQRLGCFSILAGGRVFNDGDVVERIAILIAKQRDSQVSPENAPVLAGVAFLHGIGGPSAAGDIRRIREVCGKIVRMSQFLEIFCSSSASE